MTQAHQPPEGMDPLCEDPIKVIQSFFPKLNIAGRTPLSEAANMKQPPLAAPIKSVDLVEAVRRFKELQANWPYDPSDDLTDEQLKEQGGIDITNDAAQIAIVFGLGLWPKESPKG